MCGVNQPKEGVRWETEREGGSTTQPACQEGGTNNDKRGWSGLTKALSGGRCSAAACCGVRVPLAARCGGGVALHPEARRLHPLTHSNRPWLFGQCFSSLRELPTAVQPATAEASPAPFSAPTMRELPARGQAELAGAPPVAGPSAAAVDGKCAAEPFAPAPHGFGTAGSLASTWRYASAVQSTDSDTYSEHDAADPTAPPGASLTPTATGSPASTPGGDSAANQQLWSPSKRSQAQAPFAHRPPAPPGQHPHAGFGGAALGTLPPPPGIDPASFQAGERAAFLMAFQQALPGQQALGQLFSGQWLGGARHLCMWPTQAWRTQLCAACPSISAPRLLPIPCWPHVPPQMCSR